MARKTTARRPRRPAPKTTATRSRPARPRRSRAAEVVEREPEAPAEESVSLALAPVHEAPPDGPALPAELVFPAPELAYAARMPPLPPETPIPTARRAIFLDVENSSHVPHVERVIRHLALDRRQARTDFVAVGNWRIIGHEVARLLARHGAQLLHSAPSTGVRDWSDLRIAVAAGVWMAVARPGDRIEIVSDDRAFDAVGDVASSLGVDFYRLSYRLLTGGAPAPEPAPPVSSSASRGRRRGRGRGGRGRSGAVSPPLAIAPRHPVERRPAEPVSAPASTPAPSAEPHTAPHDEIIQVVRELAQPGNRPILIDTLARELKRRGFGRTPGSPRLITRLRRIKELSVSATGMITLIAEAGSRVPDVVRAPVEPEAEPASAEAAPGNEKEPAEATTPDTATRSRPRRGGRRRRRGGAGRRPKATPPSA